MPKIKMKIVDDVTGVLSEFFGDETLRLFRNFYHEPDEVMLNADKMLTSLIGQENSRVYLEKIYKKYKLKRK